VVRDLAGAFILDFHVLVTAGDLPRHVFGDVSTLGDLYQAGSITNLIGVFSFARGVRAVEL
jgi:hypothetical protein